ncbi:MAG: aminopeptidase [Lachnospiraceae bacterium]|nr:aminopeptidase [Lachnospiraceae bacterium]
MRSERYELITERIKSITTEKTLKEPFCGYFADMALLLTELDRINRMKSDGSLSGLGIDELKAMNERLYSDIAGESYRTSHANPGYMSGLVGEAGYDPATGKLLSFAAAEFRALIPYAFEGNEEILLIYMELFVELYCLFTQACGEDKDAVPDSEEIRQHIYWFERDNCETVIPLRIEDQLKPCGSNGFDVISQSDLKDLRYLYLYGEYITGDEIETARFLNTLSEEQIAQMARTWTEGYRIGFDKTGKDLKKKKTVNIRFPIGFERVIHEAVRQFKDMGLDSVIYRASELSLNKGNHGRTGYHGAIPNRQYDYDHREDAAVYTDRDFINRKLDILKSAYEDNKEAAAVHAGPAVLEAFGEEPFCPETDPYAYTFSDKQKKLMVGYYEKAGRITNEYIRGDERSYTIIAYPKPCIGPDFESIFKETVKLNNLDYRSYEDMQQKLIDVLDRADFVKVKGGSGNETDLTIALKPLDDPEHETDFENCVADVNIPVGEVFTSPQLKGTCGLLHVKQVYLEGLEYKDLRLGFKDGVTASYSCANFEDEALNRRYIEQNLLFGHKALPMGEFAIGTNTTAYSMARRFHIERLLPILIGEKTGPHFAVGDTCYSHEEDLKSYNPDGKAIVARSNDFSDLRDSEPEKAYFNCHTDITIPYDELGAIDALMPDGSSVRIIEDGMFVLEGLLALNVPLKELTERMS